MNIVDHFFRYDQGASWGGKLASKCFHIPNNRITRKLADAMLDSRTCYHALHKTSLANEYVVQDFGIPANNVMAFIDHFKKLLLCPAQVGQDITISDMFVARMSKPAAQRMFAVGVYGRGLAKSRELVRLNCDLESEAEELDGQKLLHAQVDYTEEEIWKIFNKLAYDEVRKKSRATGLPSVYDKVHANTAFGEKQRLIRGVIETVWYKVISENEHIFDPNMRGCQIIEAPIACIDTNTAYSVRMGSINQLLIHPLRRAR